MEVGIVGGGLMGLALADRLSAAGHRVQVFEAASQIGGLATWHDFGPFVWDRFYHVILPSDTHLLRFVRDIGLGDAVRWRKTQTGFFIDSQLYPLNSGLDFLKFPPLSLWSKFRLAATILLCSRIDDWKRLEKVSVEEWLVRYSGRETYEKIWKPLLLAKLGREYERVSAVFIWSYIKRMYSARDSSAKREQLGYLSGGYKSLFDMVGRRIAAAGGEVQTSTAVSRVSRDSERRLSIESSKGRQTFDKIVFTGPVGMLEDVVDSDLTGVRRGEETVEYLGVLCGAVISRRPLMPYYVLNVADDRVPFTGVIGMSNVVNTDETAGLHLSYLPKYVLSTSSEFEACDEDVVTRFRDGLRVIFPNVDDAGIESIQINRARKVQPLQVMGYSRLVPKVETRDEDFFVLNTAQFSNNTLNNNEVIRNVHEFLARHSSEFELPRGIVE